MRVFYFLFISVLALGQSKLNTDLSSFCPTEPFSKEVGQVLTIFGFSQHCVSSALTSCANGTAYHRFQETIIDAREVVASATVALNKVTSSLAVALSCLKGDHVTSSTEVTSDEPGFAVKKPRSCAELKKNGDKTSGVRIIYPYTNNPNRTAKVYCEQETDGGGWLVFQRRMNDSLPRTNFYQNWKTYVNGFGNLNREFWLGLELIHEISKASSNVLMVELEDTEGETSWAKYNVFKVDDASTDYTLTAKGYSGTAGDGLGLQDGMKFTTFDNDNDRSNVNCAVRYTGAWWYNSCHRSNLNGYYYLGNTEETGKGITWTPWRGLNYSLATTSMAMRPLEYSVY